MSMSWLIVMFILNGVPTVPDAFPPILVPTSECQNRQQTIGDLLEQAFPDDSGIVVCLPDNRISEDPDVPA